MGFVNRIFRRKKTERIFLPFLLTPLARFRAKGSLDGAVDKHALNQFVTREPLYNFPVPGPIEVGRNFSVAHEPLAPVIGSGLLLDSVSREVNDIGIQTVLVTPVTFHESSALSRKISELQALSSVCPDSSGQLVQ